MSNKVNLTKWLPKQHNDRLRLFQESRGLVRNLRALGKKFATEINVDLPDYYEFERLLQQSRDCFAMLAKTQFRLNRLAVQAGDKGVQTRSPHKLMLAKKSIKLRLNLRKRHYQLTFIFYQMIRIMFNSPYNNDVVFDSALQLCSLYNDAVSCAMQFHASSGAQVCSRFFPPLLITPKKLDISQILQLVSKRRAEQCCLSLINCMLTTCKNELDPSDESECSSIEILRALTEHLKAPAVPKRRQSRALSVSFQGDQPLVNVEDEDEDDIDDMYFSAKYTSKVFDTMSKEAVTQATTAVSCLLAEPEENELLENLIIDEEIFIANVLMKCVKFCPSIFDGPSMNKEEMQKWVQKGSRGIWTHVGGTLEHVVLWWNTSPLACRPAGCAKYLREWLMLLAPEDAPEPILSTLKGLGETITVHVMESIWDKQFRLALVSSSLNLDYNFDNTEFATTHTNSGQNSVCGRLWSELFYSLVAIANSCDRNGTIASELPIVEQIPVLHRMDHSIHTVRIWCLTRCKQLCAEWNMKYFFMVQNDILLCWEQLRELRAPELVEPSLLEVQDTTCVALRAKVVEEIKENRDELKNTVNDCTDILAEICRITSMATLSLCFPATSIWQTEIKQHKANEYVSYYLNQLLLPVLEATQIFDTIGLVLKIMCEAWLDHIYAKKIKFSHIGAMNLLKDFDGVADWINDCDAVQDEQRDLLAKHEVLRMCEGVGKLLLRKPDEVISMETTPKRPEAF
uniref:CSON014299 protein n=1 Tax=Culicoides sonorensis TaxID=179676 RepID=A0A336MAF7_CULSO